MIRIGPNTTLAQLNTAYDLGDTATLRAYCEWNDANGDWQEMEGVDFHAELYWETIQNWFAENGEVAAP